MLSEVPEGWTHASLADFGTLLKSKGGSKADERPTGLPVVRYGELYTRHTDVVRDFYSFISEEAADNYTPLKKGDVLFAGSGETLVEIGKSAVYLRSEPAFGSGDIIILRPNCNVDPHFLGYATNGPLALAQKIRMGQGSSVMHIYAHNLAKLELPLPPLTEQRKIAEILVSVDEAIRATEAVIEQTRRVKEGLLQELLTKGIGHTRFKKTPIGEIPAGWEIKRLDGLLKGGPHNGLYKSGSDPGPATAGLLDIKGLYKGIKADFSEMRTVSATDTEISQFGIQDGDILLNRVSVKPEGVGIAVLASDVPPKTIFESNMMRLRLLDSQMLPLFLVFLLSTHQYRNWIFCRATTGSQTSINQGTVRNIPVAVPPLEEQMVIVQRLVAFEENLAVQFVALTSQQSLKQGLLQDLLTGKVRVSV